MNDLMQLQTRENPPLRDACRQWLAALARLVSPSFPADAAEAFAAFLPLLAGLPDAAFNRGTLDEAARCASRPGRVPTYAEVHAVLAAWVADHRPREVRHTTPLPSLPPAERCTPEQAAAIIARHRIDTRREPRGPVRPAYLTGDALETARASTPLVAAARAAQQARGETVA